MTKVKDVVYRLNEIWDDDTDFKDPVLRTTFVDIPGNSQTDNILRDPSMIHCTMLQI